MFQKSLYLTPTCGVAGITEQLIIVNDALICLSFIYRLHATTKLPPPTYVSLLCFKIDPNKRI